MPLVPTTKMADAHIFSLGKPLARITTWPTSACKFRPAFGATSKTRIFYKYVVFKHSFSFLHKFFAADTRSLFSVTFFSFINRSKKQQHGWASQTFISSIYTDYEIFSSLRETDCFQSQKERHLNM